ncbi:MULTISPECIES: hypothetical protein [unclassified Flavobacterium]|uniref:hypothetical protein n=1 Tax=unclassified Flavobacterium TaxID=196869 RepID=UPI001F13CAE9|nr:MULTISPECIES: hypothetical protein [unclassified Flavobacterium]UMY65677.1 hypothetical protein MKO97_14405 [Flavobacterium sp. HJ-32-4]
MKNMSLYALAALSMAFVSCKSETEKEAEKTLNQYTSFTDSVRSLAVADAKSNWAAIEASYQARATAADSAAAALRDDASAKDRLDAGREKYEQLKAQVNAELEKEATPSRPQELRDAFFGAGKIGADMDFSWVNKDNILRVYNDFYNEFDKNKDNYSREDFDEIKAMYEALDAHKNTVEKEGLTSHDNRKIAEIKLKFAPKFKWERMGAKANENQKAKDAAE